jgi:hypothetical protein
MSFHLDYDQAINLDAEDLAEGGIGRAYERLLPELRKYVEQPAPIEEHDDIDAPSYSVRFGEREFVICEPVDEGFQSWGRATFAFFTIVNDQLVDSAIRFYAINGGNDLFGMFLTLAQAKAAQQSILRRENWPYLPTDEPPWYGQFH